MLTSSIQTKKYVLIYLKTNNLTYDNDNNTFGASPCLVCSMSDSLRLPAIKIPTYIMRNYQNLY